eukprot:TRINITY_DN75291_c0_g1_i1.p1 TRINITY_DN75291_c0_g1~~TRINITY_DN75291_c0_g1_i1.p1  ORF type:complete len:354 (-),score=84.43 TRINITY_DN75291_c0_g1_i1:380-1441(-)
MEQPEASSSPWWQHFDDPPPGPVATSDASQIDRHAALQGLPLDRLAGAERQSVGFVVDILLAQADTLRQLEKKIGQQAVLSQRTSCGEAELVQALIERSGTLKMETECLTQRLDEAMAEVDERDRLGAELTSENGWLQRATDEITQRITVREEKFNELVLSEEGGELPRRIKQEHQELKLELRHFEEDAPMELQKLRDELADARDQNDELALEIVSQSREEARLDELLGIPPRQTWAARPMFVAVTNLSEGRPVEAAKLFDAFASVGTGSQRRMKTVDFGDLCEVLRQRSGRGPMPPALKERGFVNFAFAAIFGFEVTEVGRGEFIALCGDHLNDYLVDLEDEFMAKPRGRAL